MKVLITRIVLPLFMLALLPLPAFAQSSNNSGLNITTSPVVVNLVTKPGSKVTTELKVQNNSNKTEHLKIGLMKFTATGDTGKPTLLKRGPDDDYFDWVKFSEDSFGIAPNEWKTIKMTIDVPKSAAYGYYYAVTFSKEGAKVTGTTGPVTSISGAAAILTLLDVQVPGEQPKLEITDFSTDKSIYEFLPVTFNIKVKNAGNIHVVPQGNIFITRGKNDAKDLAMLSINKGQGTVLPNTNRLYSPEWTDGFPVYANSTDKDGKATKSLTWNFDQAANKLRFGQYTARMLLVYNDGTRDIPVEGSVSFWIIPWRLLLGALVVLLLVFIGLQSTVKKILGSIRGVSGK